MTRGYSLQDSRQTDPPEMITDGDFSDLMCYPEFHLECMISIVIHMNGLFGFIQGRVIWLVDEGKIDYVDKTEQDRQ
jgi:hypothetical protein